MKLSFFNCIRSGIADGLPFFALPKGRVSAFGTERTLILEQALRVFLR